MTRAQRLSLTSLALCAALPYAWLACGGSKPPPENPSNDTAGSSDTASPAASDETAPGSSAAAADTSTPTAATTAATPPPAPTFGSTDCGQCVDTTCAKQAAACGKNTDCQSMIDGIHSCDTTGASCLSSATAPTGAKPKKLAAAYQACAKKAVSKACKAKCQ